MAQKCTRRAHEPQPKQKMKRETRTKYQSQKPEGPSRFVNSTEKNLFQSPQLLWGHIQNLK